MLDKAKQRQGERELRRKSEDRAREQQTLAKAHTRRQRIELLLQNLHTVEDHFWHCSREFSTLSGLPVPSDSWSHRSLLARLFGKSPATPEHPEVTIFYKTDSSHHCNISLGADEQGLYFRASYWSGGAVIEGHACYTLPTRRRSQTSARYRFTSRSRRPGSRVSSSRFSKPYGRRN